MNKQNSTIDSALQDAIQRFADANPASLAQHQTATAVLPGGNTRTVLYHEPFPMVIAGGDGCYVTSLDGKRYLDALGEYTAGLFGHSNPVIRKAIDSALDGGIALGGHTKTEADLAALLCDRFPGLDRVRFTNSGTESNLLAIGLARALTGRSTVMVARGGYHGSMLTFGGDNPLNAPFPYAFMTYNDLASAEDAAAAVGDDLACIVVEPMMGSGGCIPGTPEFLHGLRALADRTGALLILDEVMTSRLTPGGLQQKLGLMPDLMTLGKYIGGGLTFGAFGGKAELMQRFDPSSPDALPHAGTFNNNILTMSAGFAAMSQVYTPEAAEAHNLRGDRLRDRLNASCEKAGANFQFTGIGSMITAHATKAPITEPSAAAADPRLKALFFFDMVESGIWMARRGMINLSLPMGKDEEDKIADAVDAFVTVRRALLT